MSFDEYQEKLATINQGPDRELFKERARKELKSKYFKSQIDAQCWDISNLMTRNAATLKEYIGRPCTPLTVNKNMHIMCSDDFYDHHRDEKRFTTFRSAAIIAEFYGLPILMIISEEISNTPKDEFLKKYPHLIRQNRR